MVKVLILFGHPVDLTKFDYYFDQEHRKIISTIPNLQSSKIDYVAGDVVGTNATYRIVELVFDTENDMQEGLNSKSGQLMASDYSNFATGGVSVLLCQTSDL